MQKGRREGRTLLEVISKIRGKDVIPEQHEGPVVVPSGQSLEDVAPFRVEDAHCLCQMMSLHYTAFARVQGCQSGFCGEFVLQRVKF